MFYAGKILPTKVTTFTFFLLSPHPSDDFASATFPAGEGYQRINRSVNDKKTKALVRYNFMSGNFQKPSPSGSEAARGE